ncbi:MAG: DUF2062 domain-containing protein [Sphingomonadales bacterium]|nr:DUF2062 domain-containing protein [Sphingomonadales bacterium]MDE2169507.1 DUF2062 domain-containing protein [Sphingomonadales bacterium]
MAIISLSNWARVHFPTREKLERNRWIRPFAHLVLKPDLWRFNRRSVPRGIALGLFTGIAVPFAHSPIAALCAVVVRANVPVAIATTWTSNPLTWALIFPGAIAISNLLGFNVDMTTFRALLHSDASLGAWTHWLLSHAAPALMLGLLVEALIVSSIGYGAAALGWRMWVGQKRDRRLRHRRA